MSLLAIQNGFSKCGQFFPKGCQKVWCITNNFTLGGVRWSVVEIKYEKKNFNLFFLKFEHGCFNTW